jgi:multidrug resistance protein, MATE family
LGSSNTSLHVDNSIKGILKLTLPISLARLIPEFNFLFNSIFLGHLGTKELAYAALTGVYYLVFSAVGYGLGNSILSMISRQAGENKRDGIINTLRHGFIVAGALYVIGLITTFFFLKSMLLSAGIKAEDVQAVSYFLNIRILGLIFILGYQMSNSYLICIQETKWLVVGSLVSAISNIIFDYWFIFGGLGITAMGFNGAAYASVLSEILGVLSVGFVVVYKKFSIKYDIPTTWRYSTVLLKKVFIQAAPLMAQYAISIIAWLLFYILINKYYNYSEQAASQTMRSLFGISGVFSWAFGATTNTMIANLIGQGKRDEIYPTIRKILTISCTGIVGFVILININPSIIFSIFGQGDNFSIVGVQLLRVISAAMLILTVGVIWLNAVVGTGDTKFVFLIELVSICVYLVYVYYISVTYKGTISHMWMSEWIYWSIMFALSFWFMKKKFKVL